MSGADIAVTALIAAAVLRAFAVCFRQKQKGGCCGQCTECGKCGQCQAKPDAWRIPDRKL